MYMMYPTQCLCMYNIKYDILCAMNDGRVPKGLYFSIHQPHGYGSRSPELRPRGPQMVQIFNSQ